MDGFHDDETGDVDTGHWRCIFYGPVQPNGIPEEVLEDARNYGYTAEEILLSVIELSGMAGAILTTDGQGFVWGDIYSEANDVKSPQALKEDWESYERSG
jgi:hypothetical protein